MNWRNPNSYGFAVLVAILIHLAVAGLFLVKWPESRPYMIEPLPKHIMAKVVQEENKSVKERKKKAERQKKRKERAAKRRAEKKRKLDAKRQKEKARQEKLKKETLAKQKSIAEQKRNAEAQRIAKEKAAAEEAERQHLRQAQQEAAEQKMLKELAREQAEAELQARKEAEARAERAAVMTSEYTLLIKNQIQSQWRYPPAVDASMEVELKLTLVPTGEVVQVQIVKSSGNQALDRSVEQAIYKASPLSVPQDIAIFEQRFRNFTMKFRPENASW